MTHLNLAPNVVARWAATTSSDEGSPPYECSRHVCTKAGGDEAVLGQNGPMLEARSGVCLLIPIYEPKTKTGVVIHLWRQESLWEEQKDLIERVFDAFPQLRDAPTARFVSSQKVLDEHSVQLAQAKELIGLLAPSAMLRDLLVGSPDSPDADPEMVAQGFEMSVEVYLHTYSGKMLIQDDFGECSTIDLNS